MTRGRRSTRETATAFVFAVLLVLGAGAGVGAVVVAVADGGSAASVPSVVPWASASTGPSEPTSTPARPAPTPEGRTSKDPNLGTEPSTAPAERDGVSYVALGDSYAAGQGGGDYGPVDEDGECARSAAGYPALLDAEPGIRLDADLSCNGDTTSDLLATQMDDLGTDTRLVTITVGGNDLGAIRVAAVCSLAPSSGDCRSMLTTAGTLLAPGGELEQRLRTTFADIRAAAPNARIVVTGYPKLFEGPGTGDDSEFLISTLRGAAESLNADVEAAVVAERRSGSDIIFADVTEWFAGHGVGSEDPWIHASGTDMFHPNAVGYVAYADAIRAALDCGSAGPSASGDDGDRFCF
jgi:lysophospholipase L1-like esterase